MFILFCGPDCCGKDFLMHALSKTYNYSLFMSPRSPICNIVYDKIYDRKHNLASNLELIQKFLEFNAIFVYVNVEPEILVKRAESRNEKHVRLIEDFRKHIEVYNQVLSFLKKEFYQFENRFIEIENNTDINIVIENLKNKIDKLEVEIDRYNKIYPIIKN